MREWEALWGEMERRNSKSEDEKIEPSLEEEKGEGEGKHKQNTVIKPAEPLNYIRTNTNKEQSTKTQTKRYLKPS